MARPSPVAPTCRTETSSFFRQRVRAPAADLPIRASASCDTLSSDARTDGRFIPGARVESGARSLDSVPRGSFFIQRRSPADWNHVGVIISAMGDVMETIEGNTNDEGVREGFEACRRKRGVAGSHYDFIAFT